MAIMTQTTYILAGGYDRNYPDFASRLYDEITKHANDLKLLSCFFSQQEGSWREKAEDWKEWYAKNFPTPINYDYARKDDFLHQIDLATVIFFHGGDTKLLLKNLPDTETLKKHFNNKIIVGSSAGANMLSEHYWSSTRGEYGEGRGLVDMNVMVHYGAKEVDGNIRTLEDWKTEEKLFANMVRGQVSHLPEGQFVVVQK